MMDTGVQYITRKEFQEWIIEMKEAIKELSHNLVEDRKQFNERHQEMDRSMMQLTKLHHDNALQIKETIGQIQTLTATISSQAEFCRIRRDQSDGDKAQILSKMEGLKQSNESIKSFQDQMIGSDKTAQRTEAWVKWAVGIIITLGITGLTIGVSLLSMWNRPSS
jgi:hypothetical protein